MITVTDKAGISGSVTVNKNDVADAIAPWYPEAPATVTQAIDDLQTALNRGERTGEIEALLGIEISR